MQRRSRGATGLFSLVLAAGILVSIGVSIGLTQATPVAAYGWAGNWCADYGRWFVDNGVGSEACMQRNGFVSGKSLTLTPGAYDYKRDGKSAVNQWRIHQYYSGAWHQTRSGTCRDARGYGKSEVCSTFTVNRAKNSSGRYIATRVALSMRSCLYDGDTGVYSRCTSYINKFNSSWTP